MGNILFIGGEEKPVRVDLFLDFEEATPQTEAEKKVYGEVESVLERGPHILEELRSYIGCQEAIRKAISDPTPENEEKAWLAVLPAVEKLKDFYDYSVELKRIFPELLCALCKEEDPKTSLKEQQALAKQFAFIFDFCLRFDDLKMLNPSLQNDFSYYRRTLNRMKMNKKYKDTIIIKDELSSRISIFLAYPTPMMNALTDASTNFLADKLVAVPEKNVTAALRMMTCICVEMVSDRKFNSPETNMFCLRCMTGAIILFDTLDSRGAFHKKSGMPMKACISAVKNYDYNNAYTDGLLNAIRFTTVHLHDPETPNDIKKLLE